MQCIGHILFCVDNFMLNSINYIVVLLKILQKEQMLTKQFGQHYENYKKGTEVLFHVSLKPNTK